MDFQATDDPLSHKTTVVFILRLCADFRALTFAQQNEMYLLTHLKHKSFSLVHILRKICLQCQNTSTLTF